MDLLLHLIRKNEVDIFDIPIALITDQYLEYIDMMKALNITVAGEFLVMASTLMHIKSRLLLPISDDEEEDLKEEITRPLLEFIQLKEAAKQLADRPILQRDVFTRQLPPDYMDQFKGGDETPLIQANLFQLIDAFKRVISERHPQLHLKYEIAEVSIQDKTTFILERLKEKGTVYFRELFLPNKPLGELIITFLALLELVQSGLVRAAQPDPGGDIRIEGRFMESEVEQDG